MNHSTRTTPSSTLTKQTSCSSPKSVLDLQSTRQTSNRKLSKQNFHQQLHQMRQEQRKFQQTIMKEFRIVKQELQDLKYQRPSPASYPSPPIDNTWPEFQNQRMKSPLQSLKKGSKEPFTADCRAISPISNDTSTVNTDSDVLSSEPSPAVTTEHYKVTPQKLKFTVDIKQPNSENLVEQPSVIPSYKPTFHPVTPSPTKTSPHSKLPYSPTHEPTNSSNSTKLTPEPPIISNESSVLVEPPTSEIKPTIWFCDFCEKGYHTYHEAIQHELSCPDNPSFYSPYKTSTKTAIDSTITPPLYPSTNSPLIEPTDIPPTRHSLTPSTEPPNLPTIDLPSIKEPSKLPNHPSSDSQTDTSHSPVKIKPPYSFHDILVNLKIPSSNATALNKFFVNFNVFIKIKPSSINDRLLNLVKPVHILLLQKLHHYCKNQKVKELTHFSKYTTKFLQDDPVFHKLFNHPLRPEYASSSPFYTDLKQPSIPASYTHHIYQITDGPLQNLTYTPTTSFRPLTASKTDTCSSCTNNIPTDNYGYGTCFISKTYDGEWDTTLLCTMCHEENVSTNPTTPVSCSKCTKTGFDTLFQTNSVKYFCQHCYSYEINGRSIHTLQHISSFTPTIINNNGLTNHQQSKNLTHHYYINHIISDDDSDYDQPFTSPSLHETDFTPMINRTYRSPSPELDQESLVHDNLDDDSCNQDIDQDRLDVDSITQDIIDQTCEETCEILENAIVEAADHNYNAAYDEYHNHFRDSSQCY